jgi:hypothetical protein
MVQIMRAERDVALQDRAHETYVKVTGREPPADSHTPTNAPTPLPTQGEDVKLTGGVK